MSRRDYILEAADREIDEQVIYYAERAGARRRGDSTPR